MSRNFVFPAIGMSLLLRSTPQHLPTHAEAAAIAPRPAAYDAGVTDVRKSLFPSELSSDLLNTLYAEATKRIAVDAPGSHFFGISITVWPYGDYVHRSTVFRVDFRFSRRGDVSAYVYDSTEARLVFKKDVAIAIGSENCRCQQVLWSDIERLRQFVRYGYDKVAVQLVSDPTASFVLNTNLLKYGCKWRLWFFHGGKNIGSFVLETTGPAVD
jgi:hypothetical protein